MTFTSTLFSPFRFTGSSKTASPPDFPIVSSSTPKEAAPAAPLPVSVPAPVSVPIASMVNKSKPSPSQPTAPAIKATNVKPSNSHMNSPPRIPFNSTPQPASTSASTSSRAIPPSIAPSAGPSNKAQKGSSSSSSTTSTGLITTRPESTTPRSTTVPTTINPTITQIATASTVLTPLQPHPHPQSQPRPTSTSSSSIPAQSRPHTPQPQVSSQASSLKRKRPSPSPAPSSTSNSVASPAKKKQTFPPASSSSTTNTAAGVASGSGSATTIGTARLNGNGVASGSGNGSGSGSGRAAQKPKGKERVMTAQEKKKAEEEKRLVREEKLRQKEEWVRLLATSNNLLPTLTPTGQRISAPFLRRQFRGDRTTHMGRREKVRMLRGLAGRREREEGGVGSSRGHRNLTMRLTGVSMSRKGEKIEQLLNAKFKVFDMGEEASDTGSELLHMQRLDFKNGSLSLPEHLIPLPSTSELRARSRLRFNLCISDINLNKHSPRANAGELLSRVDESRGAQWTSVLDLGEGEFERKKIVKLVSQEFGDCQITLEFSLFWVNDHSIPLVQVPTKFIPTNPDPNPNDALVHYRWERETRTSSSSTSIPTQPDKSKYFSAKGWNCPLCIEPWNYGNFTRLREHVASTHEPVLVRLAGTRKVDIGFKSEQTEWLAWEKANVKRLSVCFDLLEHSPDFDDEDADEDGEEADEREEDSPEESESEAEIDEDDYSEDEVLPVSKRPRLQGPMSVGTPRTKGKKKEMKKLLTKGSRESEDVPLAKVSAAAVAAKKSKAPLVNSHAATSAGQPTVNGKKRGEKDAVGDMTEDPAIRSFTAIVNGNTRGFAPIPPTASLSRAAPRPTNGTSTAPRLKSPPKSSRLDPKSLANKLKDLDKIWDGGAFQHQVQERDEIVFRWFHLSEKRRLLMCMWNRWTDQKGPLNIPTAETYITSWIKAYGKLIAELDMDGEMRDLLVTFLGYHYIDSDALLRCMVVFSDIQLPVLAART